MISCVVIAVLMLLGLGLRSVAPAIRRAAIPISVLAGAMGFLLAWLTDGNSRLAGMRAGILTDFGSISTSAIAVVFAGLLLIPQQARAGRSVDVWKQGITAWVIILGQVALGLIIAGLFLRGEDLPAPFGQLIEVTMAGGFGSAKAMGTLLASDVYRFPQGTDLLIFGATFGLVFGVLTGIPLANLGIRRGWVRGAPAGEISSDAQLPEPASLPAGVIDPLLLQGVFLAVAVGVGLLLQGTISFLAAEGDAHFQTAGSLKRYLGDLPLFFFALIGGWVVRRGMRIMRMDHYLDARHLHRLTGSAVDVLIVCSLARVSVASLQNHLVPTLLLLMIGAAWSMFCLLWISRRLLPQAYWFELGLINYGFSTAATSQGMMFLRLVDPEMKSGAAETYALAAPLTAPFIGGGVITFAVLPLLIGLAGPLAVGMIAFAVMLLLYFAGRRLNRPV